MCKKIKRKKGTPIMGDAICLGSALGKGEVSFGF